MMGAYKHFRPNPADIIKRHIRGVGRLRRAPHKKDGMTMELLVPIILIVALAFLANRFGADSREGIERSPETLGIHH